jgi:hypothetical protein
MKGCSGREWESGGKRHQVNAGCLQEGAPVVQQHNLFNRSGYSFRAGEAVHVHTCAPDSMTKALNSTILPSRNRHTSQYA